MVAEEDSMAAVAAMAVVAIDKVVSDLTTEKNNEND